MNTDADDWWDKTIERNRAALLRVVAVLFLFAGLDEGGADQVPRRVWRRIVRLLRPAEAATRRLIVIAARGVQLPPLSSLAAGSAGRVETRGSTPQSRSDRGMPSAPISTHPSRLPQGERPAPFPLTDPPRRFDTRGWEGERLFPEDGFMLADPDEEVGARPVCRRLLSLKNALDDIGYQARRLARWKARQMRLPGGTGRSSPIRRGHPPGRHKRPDREIDDILAELHTMALHSEAPNSS